MDRHTAMQVFAEVAERGSLTEAAQALDMSRAMVSRYLESLEHWLGARLLHRTTRRVSLTDAGAEALPRCRQLLEMSQDLLTLSGQRQGEPRGRLRITTSTSFAQACLAALVAEFLAAHPQTQVELLTLERHVNLVEERIDLAVRIGKQVDEQLIARPLAVCRSVVCAAPAYLARQGTPTTPHALSTHRCITHAYVGRIDYRLHHQGQLLHIPVQGALQTHDTTVSRAAALAGAGIALLPTYLVNHDLVAGRLVRLLPDCEPETLGIHGAYLSRQHQPLVLRGMLDFLAERLGGPVAPWDRVWDSTPAKAP